MLVFKEMAKPFEKEKYTIQEKEPISNGHRSKVDAVELSVGEHKIPLIRKKHKGYAVEAPYAAEWHTLLQGRGYPVSSTWRYDKDKRTHYVTDERRGGKNIVIDFCNHAEECADIQISNFEEVKREADALVEKAVSDRLAINEPNIFFIVDKETGRAKILMGDLDELGYEADDPRDEPSEDEIRRHNQYILKGHLDCLQEAMRK